MLSACWMLALIRPARAAHSPIGSPGWAGRPAVPLVLGVLAGRAPMGRLDQAGEPRRPASCHVRWPGGALSSRPPASAQHAQRRRCGWAWLRLRQSSREPRCASRADTVGS